MAFEWMGTVRNRFLPEWRRVLLADPCVYCGRPAEGLDHIKPRSRKGSDHWENRAPACRDCDNLKADTGLLVFLWAHGIAERRVRLRQYEHAYARRAAIDMLRQRIAYAFYSGNLRFTASGRLKFAGPRSEIGEPR